MTVTAVTFN